MTWLLDRQARTRMVLWGDDLDTFTECCFFDDLPGIWLKLAIVLFGPVDGIALMHELAPRLRARKAPERWVGMVGTACELVQFAYAMVLSNALDKRAVQF